MIQAAASNNIMMTDENCIIYQHNFKSTVITYHNTFTLILLLK